MPNFPISLISIIDEYNPDWEVAEWTELKQDELTSYLHFQDNEHPVVLSIVEKKVGKDKRNLACYFIGTLFVMVMVRLITRLFTFLTVIAIMSSVYFYLTFTIDEMTCAHYSLNKALAPFIRKVLDKYSRIPRYGQQLRRIILNGLYLNTNPELFDLLLEQRGGFEKIELRECSGNTAAKEIVPDILERDGVTADEAMRQLIQQCEPFDAIPFHLLNNKFNMMLHPDIPAPLLRELMNNFGTELDVNQLCRIVNYDVLFEILPDLNDEIKNRVFNSVHWFPTHSTHPRFIQYIDENLDRAMWNYGLFKNPAAISLIQKRGLVKEDHFKCIAGNPGIFSPVKNEKVWKILEELTW